MHRTRHVHFLKYEPQVLDVMSERALYHLPNGIQLGFTRDICPGFSHDIYLQLRLYFNVIGKPHDLSLELGCIPETWNLGDELQRYLGLAIFLDGGNLTTISGCVMVRIDICGAGMCGGWQNH
jgi:hypothetical protein